MYQLYLIVCVGGCSRGWRVCRGRCELLQVNTGNNSILIILVIGGIIICVHITLAVCVSNSILSNWFKHQDSSHNSNRRVNRWHRFGLRWELTQAHTERNMCCLFFWHGWERCCSYLSSNTVMHQRTSQARDFYDPVLVADSPSTALPSSPPWLYTETLST